MLWLNCILKSEVLIFVGGGITPAKGLPLLVYNTGLAKVTISVRLLSFSPRACILRLWSLAKRGESKLDICSEDEATGTTDTRMCQAERLDSLCDEWS